MAYGVASCGCIWFGVTGGRIENIAALNQCADTIQEMLEHSKECSDHDSFTLALETLWRLKDLRGQCLKNLKEEQTKDYSLTLECTDALFADLCQAILITSLVGGQVEMTVKPTSGPSAVFITLSGTQSALSALHASILDFFRGYKGTVMMKLSNVHKISQG